MFHIPDYELGQRIYEGKKSRIYRGGGIKDNTPVLLKFLYAEYPDINDVARLKKEYELNRRIQSNNVVKIYCIENYKKSPVLIFEDFKGESLQTILDTFKKLNLMDFFKIAIKLFLVLKMILVILE